MATYPPPNPQSGSIFNPSDWIEGNNSNLDIEYLNEHYCKFPVAQGNMSFAGISNTGTTTIGQNIVMTGTANVNYLEFPDLTRQYTAVAGDDILDTANTFTKNNTFPSISLNTGTGANLTSSNSGLSCSANLTAPKFIINDNVDDSYQIYSQNTGDFGLVISNTSGLNGKLTISNGSTTLTSLTSYLYALGDVRLDVSTQISVPTQTEYSPSTTYVNVLATQAFVKSAIQSQGGGDASLTANQTFTGINTFSNNVNFSSIVNETTQFSIGNKLRLTLDTGPTFVQSYFELNSDGTTTYSNIINLPSQTYDGGVAYGNVASTQQFVIQAIASQGGGDVYLNGANDFTGTNTFNTNLPSSTIGGVYPNYGTPNSFATIGYVNSLTTTINSTFSGNLGIASIGFPNYMTSHLVGNIIYYSGYIAFVPSGNPSKVSFNINPALNITLQTNIQNASLYSVDTSTGISIDASQTYLFNNALIIQLYGGLSGGTYNFQFSGNAQYS